MNERPDDIDKKEEKRPLSRREFLIAAGTIGASVALASCAPKATESPTKAVEAAPTKAPTVAPTSPPPTSEPVTVRYWGNPIPEYSGPHLDERIAAFEAEHPGIKVVYEPYPDDGMTKFLAQAVAGTAPDIIEGSTSSYQTFIKAGAALDLTPYLSSVPENYLDEWPTGAMDFLTLDSGTYGLPYRAWHMVLIYNKDLFDEVGVSYPDGSWTHADYLENMIKFVKEEGGKKVRWGGHEISKASIWLENKLRVFGGSIVDLNDDSRCALGDPEAQQGFQWLNEAIWETNAWPQTAQIENYWFAPFDSGALATMASGSWIISILDGGIEDRFKWDFAPYPAGPDGTKASVASLDVWIPYSGTKNPDATFEVLKWLISDEMEAHMMESAGSEPSRSSLFPKWKEIVRGRFPRLASANLEAFEEPVKEGYDYIPRIFKDQPAADEILNPALEAFIDTGSMKAEDFVQLAEEITASQQG